MIELFLDNIPHFDLMWWTFLLSLGNAFWVLYCVYKQFRWLRSQRGSKSDKEEKSYKV